MLSAYLAISAAYWFTSINAFPSNNHNIIHKQRAHQNDDDDIMLSLSHQQTHQADNSPDGQSFFQSFAPFFASPPLGHSRPLLYPDHSLRSSVKSATFRELPFNVQSDNVLGSGNFGIIKGGTYYAEDGDTEGEADNSYQFSENGHGRPAAYYKRNPLPAYRNGGDFFAGFRDFADITTPTKSSYSQYYVVYVKQNATTDDNKEVKTHPRNIIEQLAMMDQQVETKQMPLNKLSKIKQKLLVHKQEQAEKEKRVKLDRKDNSEPLLALS